VSPSVLCEGLTFAYPNGSRLFEKLDLVVEIGSFTCITGRSGVGKSTLLYCLSGVLAAEGRIDIMGERMSASAMERTRLRLRHCGFIFQRGELLPELTVLENVALPLRLNGRRRRVAHREAEDFLQRLGIADCGQRTPDEISGGQAQRASVARALINKPGLVLADEPTASLDGESRAKVIESIRAAAADGAAVVCATHDADLMEAADARIHLGDSTGVVDITH